MVAATHLRLGFVENGYIAEMLCGNPRFPSVGHAARLAPYHAEPSVAKAYVRNCGALWHETAVAVVFLRWLHSHPRVMSKRAAILEWNEALFWEGHGGLRQSILSAWKSKLDGIDDTLSERLVAAREDQSGQVVLPWLHSGARPGT